MKTIWKFKVDYNVIDPEQPVVVLMPDGAEILPHAELQDSRVAIWAMVDPKAPLVAKLFKIVGTGWELSDDFKTNHNWIATVQSEDYYVWHIFQYFNKN